jgi:hypothetical protein
MAEGKPKTHVIVTRVTPVREGGRIIVHAYGPYAQGYANEQRQKMLREADKLGYRNRLEVSVCKMLDPEMVYG